MVLVPELAKSPRRTHGATRHHWHTNHAHVSHTGRTGRAGATKTAFLATQTGWKTHTLGISREERGENNPTNSFWGFPWKAHGDRTGAIPNTSALCTTAWWVVAGIVRGTSALLCKAGSSLHAKFTQIYPNSSSAGTMSCTGTVGRPAAGSWPRHRKSSCQGSSVRARPCPTAPFSGVRSCFRRR